MSTDEYRRVTKKLKEESMCKNCGHNGDMHSDEEYTHTGECFIKLKDGSFCGCEEFVSLGADE